MPVRLSMELGAAGARSRPAPPGPAAILSPDGRALAYERRMPPGAGSPAAALPAPPRAELQATVLVSGTEVAHAIRSSRQTGSGSRSSPKAS